MVVRGGLWWFYGGSWQCVVVYGGLLWVVVVYGGLWWFTMVCGGAIVARCGLLMVV